MKTYKFLVCGGTFDLLHKGHKGFLNQALALADKVLIGITSDDYVKSLKNESKAQNFNVRKKAVEDYLKQVDASKKAQIVKINNAYEPYLETSADYDAILVTEKVRSVAEEINLRRKQNGIYKLKIIDFPVALAEDGLEISSGRIRNGEINRNGRLYLNSNWENKTLILPKNLRFLLKVPWGEVLREIPKRLDSAKTIAVGDATAEKFNQQGLNQFLSIVDFLINREVRFKTLKELGFGKEIVQKVKNPHSQITPELSNAIWKSLKDKDRQIILVDGEEDLAALAVLLIAPLGFSIFYGQPNQGLVWLKVTEENKDRAFSLLSQFVVE